MHLNYKKETCGTKVSCISRSDYSSLSESGTLHRTVRSKISSQYQANNDSIIGLR